MGGSETIAEMRAKKVGESRAREHMRPSKKLTHVAHRNARNGPAHGGTDAPGRSPG